MLKHILPEECEKISQIISCDRYEKNPFYLAFNGYSENKNKELLFYVRDELFANEFPFIAIPQTKVNLKNSILAMVTEKEIADIEHEGFRIINKIDVGKEFYYDTREMLNLDKNKQLRKDVNRFKKNYTYQLLEDYPTAKVINFIEQWAEKQKDKNDFFENAKEYALFCIQIRAKIRNAKWLFLEIAGKLCGYCISYKVNELFWIGIHQKVDYSYKGIGRFLLYNRVLQFRDSKSFTLGSSAGDKGIEIFKESLFPIREEKMFFIVVAEK